MTGTRHSDVRLPSMVVVDGTDSVPQKAKKEEKRGQGEGIRGGRKEKRVEEERRGGAEERGRVDRKGNRKGGEQ